MSATGLETRIEWNLVSCFALGDSVEQSLKSAFTNLWGLSTTLTSEVAERYSIFAKKAREFRAEPEAQDVSEPMPEPRPWQGKALESLDQLRSNGCPRALVAVATGLSKNQPSGV
jgi:hypothetical protein